MARRVKKGGISDIRAAAKRSNVTFLRSMLMLFQFSAFALLALKKSPLDMQALTYAICLPAVTYLCLKVIPRVWAIDRILLTLVLFLCSVSIVTLKDIARAESTSQEQALFMLIGIAMMLGAIAFIRKLRNWEKWILPLMIVSVVALALPIVIGDWRYGAKNWIKVFNISVQPSEFVKLSLAAVLSISFSRQSTRRQQYVTLGFAVLLCGILLVERDLGALLIYFFLTLALFYLGTSNGWLTLAGLGAGAAGSVLAYHSFDYVKARVETFVNPWADPQDSSYQIVQALIAIGSGGMFGMGLGLGLPRNIPLYHSDFIFAAISEEFGYIFALCLLAVYVLIIMRGISIAMNARNRFHALLAFGMSALIGVQTLIAVGGNTKLIPLTGVTLPFVAAGGSSLMSCFLAVGFLLGISSINAQYEQDDIRKAEWQEAAPK